MPPVTVPPPAEKTRRPETAKGALLVELQLPASVVKTTFQVPSKALTERAARASAEWVAPKAAARTVTAKSAGLAPPRPKFAKSLNDRNEIVIFPIPVEARLPATDWSIGPVLRFIVANT